MKRIFTLLLTLVTISGFTQKKDFVVTFKTKYGDMVAILYDETPKHKANFIKLAKEHYYDSTLFHRVINDFMIQGGDPNSKKAKPGDQLGNGGPEYTIEAEINPKFYHAKGALAAARQSDEINPSKASSGSQFYIVKGKIWPERELRVDPASFNNACQTFFSNPNNAIYLDTLNTFRNNDDIKGFENYLLKILPTVEKETGIKTSKDISPEILKAYTEIGGTPHLDGSYTIFGKVVKGLDVIDKIAALPGDQANRPTEDVRVMVTVEEVSKKTITKLYGYVYPEIPKKKK